jgi:hypothetical protein
MSLTFERTATHWIIKGKTFEWKDKIKALAGAFWSPEERAWRVPVTTNIEDFQDDVVLTQVERQQELKKLKLRPPPYGRCCSKAAVKEKYSEGPLYYDCPEHGRRDSDRLGGYVGT